MSTVRMFDGIVEVTGTGSGEMSPMVRRMS